MSRLRREHDREIKRYLVDNYGATHVHLQHGKGDHSRLHFTVDGVQGYVSTTARTDSRGIESQLCDIRSQLGEPRPQTKTGTTLEALTMAAHTEAHRKANGNGANGASNGNGTSSQTRDLAKRALDWNNKPPEAPKSETASSPSEPIRPLNVVFASMVDIHADDISSEYDLIFKTRRKQVTGDGQINVMHRSVAAVTVPRSTICELFDELRPIVDILRPAPEPEPGPDPAILNLTLGLTADGRFVPEDQPVVVEKGKRRPHQKTPEGVAPVGLEAIMTAARKLRQARADIIESTGGVTMGGPFNTAMSAWLRENQMDKMPGHIRNDLNFIGKNIEQFEEWSKKYPLTRFAKLAPSGLIRLYKQTPPPPPPEPKIIDTKPKLLKRNKKKPAEPPQGGKDEAASDVAA